MKKVGDEITWQGGVIYSGMKNVPVIHSGVVTEVRDELYVVSYEMGDGPREALVHFEKVIEEAGDGEGKKV